MASVLGLSGGIGTGKSTVAHFLGSLGATVIDADAIVHELQAPGTPMLDEIAEAFGSDIIDTEGLELDGAAVHYVARWVTPVGPPRRYDTRFVVTAMPASQVPLHDDDEAVNHEWVRAAEALSANERGEMVMMTPTLSMLQRLASFSTIEQALASAAEAKAQDDESIRIRFNVEGHHRIAYPGDADFVESDQHAESGVLRWPRPWPGGDR